jgi:hypothetical protein
VWVGHCYELAATPPYGPWVDSGIFDQRSEDVLSPPMPGVGSRTASSQAALFERMQEFLAGVVRQNPLVLILEDLHWSDPASLELLRFVSRNLHELRILLVVTYRDDEVTRRSPRVKDDQKRERSVDPGNRNTYQEEAEVNGQVHERSGQLRVQGSRIETRVSIRGATPTDRRGHGGAVDIAVHRPEPLMDARQGHRQRLPALHGVHPVGKEI